MTFNKKKTNLILKWQKYCILLITIDLIEFISIINIMSPDRCTILLRSYSPIYMSTFFIVWYIYNKTFIEVREKFLNSSDSKHFVIDYKGKNEIKAG